MRGLTVIATHNGWDYLENALISEKKFGNWPVLVVDTCSEDKSFENVAYSISKKYGAKFISQTIPRYDFGAYMLAPTLDEYRDYDAFWFKHDSLYLKSSKFYPLIEKELLNYDMIGWHFFSRRGSSFDNEEQREWLIEKFGTDDYDYGFYGPNLVIGKDVLKRLSPELNKIVVDTKIKQQAMERGWAIVAKKYKLSILFLENYKGDVQSNNYEFFIKSVHNAGVPRQ